MTPFETRRETDTEVRDDEDRANPHDWLYERVLMPRLIRSVSK